MALLIIFYYALPKESSVTLKRIKELEFWKGGDEREERVTLYNNPFFKTQEELNKLGVARLTPISYMANKIILASIAFFITRILTSNIWICVFAASGGFFIVDSILSIKNRSSKSNTEPEIDLIRLDLAEICDNIKSSVNSGSSIEESIISAGASIRNSKKLKKEWAVLSAEIAITSRIEDALNVFNRKFKCKEIRKFVALLMKALINGNVEITLSGFKLQLQKKNNAYIEKQVNKIPEKINGIGYQYYIGVIALFMMAIMYTIVKSGQTILK